MESSHARGAADSLEASDALWTDVLKAGVWGEAPRRDPATVTVDRATIDGIGVAAPEFSGSSDVYPFVLHPYLSTGLNDGRGANLPWMQELPDPMTSVVYGSWVEMNPKTAEKLGLKEGGLGRSGIAPWCGHGARLCVSGDSARMSSRCRSDRATRRSAATRVNAA